MRAALYDGLAMQPRLRRRCTHPHAIRLHVPLPLVVGPNTALSHDTLVSAAPSYSASYRRPRTATDGPPCRGMSRVTCPKPPRRRASSHGTAAAHALLQLGDGLGGVQALRIIGRRNRALYTRLPRWG